MLMKLCTFIVTYVLVLRGVHSQATQTCTCVGFNTCYQSLTSDGSGQIDIRIVNSGTGTLPPITPVPPITGIPICSAGSDVCCTGAGVTGCGLRWNIPPTPTTTATAGQARYGGQPWAAVILGTDNTYVGGGVLLDSFNVLTVAHKVANRTAASLKIRMGEWDSNRVIEPYPTVESLVLQIRVHPQYNGVTLANDLAILRLATAIQLGPNPNPTINTGCLPAVGTNTDNLRCIVSGWGKDAFTGSYQSIIKEVDVPILTNADCTNRLRTTRLGPSYNLDTNSFLCAGGEAGRDACVGDGGSGLMCDIGGRYQVVGLVAWGIGCATANVPGVYIKVQNFIPWIQQNQV